MKSTLMILYAETPLHVGSGVGLGAVDLPIQRERMSSLPMVQGSGLKGALREQMWLRRKTTGGSEKALDQDEFLALFGPWAPERPNEGASDEAADSDDDAQGSDGDKETSAAEFASALSILDARLLLFPVRTAFGAFAWLTCPLILDRLGRDLCRLGMTLPAQVAELEPGEGKALCTSDSAVSREGHLIVEDMDYEAKGSREVDKLASYLAEEIFPQPDEYRPFRDRIAHQLAVVDDTEFTFLCQHATEVVARTRIDDKTGTVQRGALWTEEALPTESVLWTVATFTASRRPGDRRTSATLRQRFTDAANDLSRIYLGGDRTVGRGLVGLRVEPEHNGEER